MYTLGRIVLSVGVLIFLVAGGGMLVGFVPSEGAIAAPIAALALILIGAGAGMVRKYRNKP